MTTRFTQIDLSQLPAPAVIEALDFEAIFEEMKAAVIEAEPDLDEVMQLESEPAVKVLQVCAYQVLLTRARVNDAGKAVMIAFATGSDLDHLGALFGVARFEDETDKRLRERIQLSLEGFSTAGPVGAYIFHARSADERVKDVQVSSPNPGDVLVTVLSSEANGTPDGDLLGAVSDTLTATNVRPLTDTVIVQAATVTTYEVDAVLHILDGLDANAIRDAAHEAARVYADSVHRLGRDVTRSGLFAALHRQGVERVDLNTPAADIENDDTEAAFCTGVTLAVESPS